MVFIRSSTSWFGPVATATFPVLVALPPETPCGTILRLGAAIQADDSYLQEFPTRLLKNGFFVILNEVKDIELININGFFAAFRMTN
jgi:hypothetical protein